MHEAESKLRAAQSSYEAPEAAAKLHRTSQTPALPRVCSRCQSARLTARLRSNASAVLASAGLQHVLQGWCKAGASTLQGESLNTRQGGTENHPFILMSCQRHHNP